MKKLQFYRSHPNKSPISISCSSSFGGSSFLGSSFLAPLVSLGASWWTSWWDELYKFLRASNSYPVPTEMAAKFLKALAIMWGIAHSVGMPNSIDKAVMLATP